MVIRNATEELKRISQNGFQECFQDVRSRWLMCSCKRGTVLKKM